MLDYEAKTMTARVKEPESYTSKEMKFRLLREKCIRSSYSGLG